MVRKLLHYLKPYRLRLFWLFLISVFTSLLNVAQPSILGQLTASVFEESHGLSVPLLPGKLFPGIPTAVILPGLMVIVLLLRVGTVFAQSLLNALIAGGTLRDIRGSLFDHLQRLSVGFFEKNQTGQVISRVTNDTNALQSFLQSAGGEAAIDLLTVIAGLTYVFYLDWSLALVTMVVMCLVAWPISRVGDSIRVVGRNIQARWADLTGVLGEAISGIRVVKAFQMEPIMARRFNKESGSVYRASVKSAKIVGLLLPTTEFLGGLAIALFIWFGIARIRSGALMPQNLFTFIFVVGFLTAPVTRLTRFYNQYQLALAAAERVFEILATETEVKEAPVSHNPPKVCGEIRFEDVSFGYDSGPLILSGIDLTVRPGEVLAVVGPSGAGKTSLVNLIPRFYDPAAGRVLLDGYDLRTMSLVFLRGQLGIVPQDTMLFRATVAENIGYGRPGATAAEISHAAELANADEFIRAMPAGYDTLVGERGLTLSGGQRQRLAIARAFLRNPRVLILDEATSALDSASESLVQDSLEFLMQGRTTFVIAHRLSTVRRANRLAVIADGRLVELGNHEELLRLGGVYARLYHKQFEGAAT